ELALRSGKDIDNVALLAAADLDADGIDQDQLGDPRRRAHRDLGREPAAERIAEHDRLLELERIHQIEIEIDEVLETVEVIRNRRTGKARMDRLDQLEAFGETIGKRKPENRTAAAVQHQHAWTAAFPAHLEIDALQPVAGRREINHPGLLASADATPLRRS